jgi:hypothetical protein
MPPKPQNIYDEYFKITREYTDQYGPTTILFYQVGAFFEMYGLQDTEGNILKSKVEDFTQITQLNMSDKDIKSSYGDVIMFADAGCEFTGNPQMFVDIAREYGFLGFRLPIAPKHYVQRWTKGDIFEALGVDMELFGTEKQHVGGIFLIQ